MIGAAAFLAALIYCGAVVARQAAFFGSFKLTESAACAVIGAIVLYASLFCVLSLCWTLLLKGMGAGVRYVDASIVLAISQFAKYLPGNVGHHIGRVILAKRYNLGTPSVLFSIILEQAWSTAAATLLALFGLLTFTGEVLADPLVIPPAWAVGLLLVGVVTAPHIGLWALTHCPPAVLKKLTGGEHVRVPALRVLFFCLVLYGIAFLGLGLIIGLLAWSMFSVPANRYWVLTGAFAIAWIAGLIAPGAPAGLGVREAALIAILGPAIGEAAALGVSVALRAVTTLGDGLIFLLGLAGKRFVRPGQAPAIP